MGNGECTVAHIGNGDVEILAEAAMAEKDVAIPLGEAEIVEATVV